MKCRLGECHVGSIANRPIEERDWVIESFKFEGKIELAEKLRLPNAGHLTVFKYCPKCGVEIHESRYLYTLGGKAKYLRVGKPI